MFLLSDEAPHFPEAVPSWTASSRSNIKRREADPFMVEASGFSPLDRRVFIVVTFRVSTPDTLLDALNS